MFLENLVKAGRGQQCCGQAAHDLFYIFDEELLLLQALCLRQFNLNLIPAQGMIIEPLSVSDLNSDDTYQLSDFAWDVESWQKVRMPISTSAEGESRDLLALTMKGMALGEEVAAHAAMLRLRALDQSAYDAQHTDEARERRLQEVEFAKSSLELSRLINAGNVNAGHALVKDLEKRFGQQPWLQAN